MANKSTVLHEIRKKQFLILFVSILLLGIFARVWEIRTLPNGLHQDEASIGVEAYSLVHYGIDRNKISYPVNFISWGSGQNVLYGYLLIPFVAIFGLRPIVIRMPMILTGILTLPLTYLLGKKIINKTFGLLFMFFIAISPWHILLSRWGLESNIFPFFFILGFLCFLFSQQDNYWFVLGMFFFALCLYTYGTSYVVVPLFLLIALPLLAKNKQIDRKNFPLGISTFIILALPIGLYILINSLKLETIYIGPITVPRLPAQTRYESLSTVFKTNFWNATEQNLTIFFKLLIYQTDGKLRNSMPFYGYFYGITFPLSIVGAIFLVRLRQQSNSTGRLLLVTWMLTAFFLGLLQPVNTNRINIIFIPLIFNITYFVYWLSTYWKITLPLTVISLLIAFTFFTRDYHSTKYQDQAQKEFFSGFLPAIHYILQQDAHSPVCITKEKMLSPYIYIMFSDPQNLVTYTNNIEYTDDQAEFRQAQKMGHYTFGLENCEKTPNTIYLLFQSEHPPRGSRNYNIKFFEKYQVYIPK